MNKKLHIIFTFMMFSLMLVGCERNSTTNISQQITKSNLVTPEMNEATKAPEETTPSSAPTPTPTTSISTRGTIDYNQYVKKTWIMSKEDQTQEIGVSFIITSINNNKMTGELTVVGPAPSYANTVADLDGTINNDMVECQFTDTRGNEGTINFIFKTNDAIDATISLKNKSDLSIAQPPEGVFHFTPLNIKDNKEFSPMEDQSFIVELNSWGEVKFVTGKYNSPDYVPVGFFITDKDGDILYQLDSPITNNVDVKAVSFKDVNQDGLKDIIVITSDVDNSGDAATIFLQEYDGAFSNDPELDRDINTSGNNKDVKSVTDYLITKFKELSDNEVNGNKDKSSQLNENLCKEDEKVIYSFRTSKEQKAVSLCINDEEDYIIFRYGTKDKIEMEYPDILEDSWNSFAYCYYLRGGGPENEGLDLNFITFKRNEYSYILYEKYYASKEVHQYGLSIINNHNGEEKDIPGSSESVTGTLIDFRGDSRIFEGSYVDSLIME